MSWKFNPYSPCCCHDGTYCVTPEGCVGGDEYGGAHYTEFPISLVETATGLDAPGSPTTASQGDPACFTLAGDTEYTLTIAKDRWTTFTVTFTTPCAESAWSLHPVIPMVPAEGYGCPCNLNISPVCVDAVKLPFILNDGFGDVVLPPGTGGAGSFTAVCGSRMAVVGCEDCGCDAKPNVSVPVSFGLITCVPGAAPVRWCGGFEYGGGLRHYLVAGDCTPPTGRCSPFDDAGPCGALIVLPGDALTVSCSPYTVTQQYTVVGCMRDIYGGAVTLTLTESP
jgi:hypothetical protein